MRASRTCLELIKRWEGCRLTAYRCPAGIWTIGYGQTGPTICEGLRITETTAESFLIAHVDEVARSVCDLNIPNLNQNQFDAIVSFTYNVGIGALVRSNILYLLRGDPAKNQKPRQALAAAEFAKWTRARDPKTGQLVVLAGLVSRRLAERALFETQVKPFASV